RLFLRAAHREHDGRSAHYPGLARRPRRRGDPSHVEGEEHRLRAGAGNRHQQVPRQAFLLLAPDATGRNRGADTVLQLLASAAAPAAFTVPERIPRSCSPPCMCGVGVNSRRARSAPIPTGAPILCPEILSALTPLASKSMGTCAAACTASLCTRAPCRDAS